MTRRWTEQDIPDLSGTIAVVTGANSGLGVATTRGLAAAGAHVVMACRNQEKAENTATEISESMDDPDLEILQLDLADLTSVRTFAETFRSRHDHLDLLVNNAGVMALPFRRTADGFEMQFGTNHLGHFALTGLLLDSLRAADKARVVTVSSLAHKAGRTRLEDLNWQHGYDKWKAYGQSKLANLLFALELDRRLKTQGESLVSLAAHPGISATNLAAVGPEMAGSKLRKLVMDIAVNKFIGQSRDRGALPTLYAATSADAAGGEYYGPGGIGELHGDPAPARPNGYARDEEMAARLWTASEQLTGVSYLSG